MNWGHLSEPDGKGGLRWVEGGVITLADGSTRKFFEFDLLKPYVAAWRDIDVHPPSNPLAHPCGPSTLAASILAGSFGGGKVLRLPRTVGASGASLPISWPLSTRRQLVRQRP